MKSALLLLFTFLLSTSISAQTKTYLAESWANVELYHDLPTAIRNTIYEKVSVVVSPTIIQATFGNKTRVYAIKSKKPVNEMSTAYTTIRDNKTVIIIIVDWNNIYSMSCNNEWSILEFMNAYTSK